MTFRPKDRAASPTNESALRDLIELHHDTDRAVEALRRVHAVRLRCARGCFDCCIDGLTVFTIEAARIRRSCQTTLGEPPHAPGRCAFLSTKGACRIYAHRPYVCRTQGLPLRYFEPNPEGETVEYRDICPLNDVGPPLESLPDDQLWTIGPYEGRLAQLAMRFEGQLTRVALRDLFRS